MARGRQARDRAREHPLDAIEQACRKEGPLFGAYYDIAFDRQDADTFEMRVHRHFFRDHFTRHDNPMLTTVMCAWDANWLNQRFDGEQHPG